MVLQWSTYIHSFIHSQFKPYINIDREREVDRERDRARERER